MAQMPNSEYVITMVTKKCAFRAMAEAKRSKLRYQPTGKDASDSSRAALGSTTTYLPEMATALRVLPDELIVDIIAREREIAKYL